jgi:hypothetical protein
MLLTECVISSFISASGWGVLLTSMTLQNLHVLDVKLLLLPHVFKIILDVNFIAAILNYIPVHSNF